MTTSVFNLPTLLFFVEIQIEMEINYQFLKVVADPVLLMGELRHRVCLDETNMLI